MAAPAQKKESSKHAKLVKREKQARRAQLSALKYSLEKELLSLRTTLPVVRVPTRILDPNQTLPQTSQSQIRCLDCRKTADRCMCGTCQRCNRIVRNLRQDDLCLDCYIDERKKTKFLRSLEFDLPSKMQCVGCRVMWNSKELTQFGVCPDCVSNVKMDEPVLKNSCQPKSESQLGSKRQKIDSANFKEIEHLQLTCKDCGNHNLILALSRENADLKSTLISLELGGLKM